MGDERCLRLDPYLNLRLRSCVGCGRTCEASDGDKYCSDLLIGIIWAGNFALVLRCLLATSYFRTERLVVYSVVHFIHAYILALPSCFFVMSSFLLYSSSSVISDPFFCVYPIHLFPPAVFLCFLCFLWHVCYRLSIFSAKPCSQNRYDMPNCLDHNDKFSCCLWTPHTSKSSHFATQVRFILCVVLSQLHVASCCHLAWRQNPQAKMHFILN